MNAMSEKEFQSQVIQLARLRGWLCYHTRDSRKSAKGFPDLVLVRDRLLFAELKTDSGKVTAEQQYWLDAINEAGGTACIWRPTDWKAIERELT